jgi:hypothetical protein
MTNQVWPSREENGPKTSVVSDTGSSRIFNGLLIGGVATLQRDGDGLLYECLPSAVHWPSSSAKVFDGIQQHFPVVADVLNAAPPGNHEERQREILATPIDDAAWEEELGDRTATDKYLERTNNSAIRRIMNKMFLVEFGGGTSRICDELQLPSAMRIPGAKSTLIAAGGVTPSCGIDLSPAETAAAALEPKQTPATGM